MKPPAKLRTKSAILGLLGAIVVLSSSPLWSAPPLERSEAAISDAAISDAAARASHQRMLEELAVVRERTLAGASYIGQGEAVALRQWVANLSAQAPVTTRVEALFRLGEAELRLGNTERAVALLGEARELAREGAASVPAALRDQLTFRLAVANLRLGETENCHQRFVPDSCILPIRGDAVYAAQDATRRAVARLLEVLEVTPRTTTLHLGALWLLNLAHMNLGSYPDGVPLEHRIPPAAFASDQPFPRFANVAPALGLDTQSLSGGAVADDFDGDEDLDLLVSTWDPAGQLRFFRNRGDGSFEDATGPAGLTGITGGLNLVQADFDNDGDIDVLVLRGAWLDTEGHHPNSLLRNDGQGRFLDVAFAAGLGERHFPTQTAAWCDLDNDGDLDLYVGNESSETQRSPSQLFRNRGDGTFDDVAAAAGVTNDDFAKAVVCGDVDGDRFPDLYVSNLGGANRLYRNRGDGTFVDIAAAAGVEGPIASFPSWFFDFDNDGDLDLFVAAYAANIGHLAASYLGLRPKVELARLYRNDGARFVDIAPDSGLVRPSAPMGSNFGDLDGDGWLDFYLGTGYPDYQDLMPNLLYRNREGRGFADVTLEGGFGHLQKGHAVVFADFDADGDLDLFEQMGGALPGDGFRDVLYENPGFGSRWLALHLVGTTSNRSAIGARIRVEVADPGGARRTIHRQVGSGGSFGANPLRQFLGLGAATRIILLEVYWPTSQITQRFADIAPDRYLRLVEGEDELRVITVPRADLASGTAARRP
jgi:hypothetical protein